MSEAARHTKVARFWIVKPVEPTTWQELGERLRHVRYCVYRLANLAVSEAYLGFHLWRTGQTKVYKKATVGKLSRRLREMLKEEKKHSEEALERISKDCATPATVHDALSKYKIGGITAENKWREVMRGKASLPTFRTDMAIPIRCDKNGQARLERTEGGDVVVDLIVCRKPWPRVVLATRELWGSQKAILEELLKNEDQSLGGYRQRAFEVKYDERGKRWWLYVTYDLPARQVQRDGQMVVGVDVGVSCPLYAAVSNGHARMGWKAFVGLAARVRSLQRQVIGRRRSIQRGGNAWTSGNTARSGHGRDRKLQAIEHLEGRIDSAYTTLNHQLSAAVVEFARSQGAGVIQMEDLKGLHVQGHSM